MAMENKQNINLSNLGFNAGDIEERHDYSGQEKEIETIKLRNYSLNLSDADVERIAYKAAEYHLTVSELLENFIGDLVGGTYSNGSDERMYANQWAERCGFAYSERNLISYLASGWHVDFHDLHEILENINDTRKDIEYAQQEIKTSRAGWRDIVIYSKKPILMCLFINLRKNMSQVSVKN